MNEQGLRIHDFLPASRSNGPGLRVVIWVQGCSLDCPGCFNPETHAPTGGEIVSIDALVQRVNALAEPVTGASMSRIEGVTISGGEPLEQARPLLALLHRIKAETAHSSKCALSVVLFTGYSWSEIQRQPVARDVLTYVDVLIAGRYDVSQPIREPLRSSVNQTLHRLTDRYSEADLQAVPPAEVILTAEGEVLISGTDPVKW